MPGKKRARGRTGIGTKLVSRSKATRHMRLSLDEFNKLCILKGIYPRVPKHKGNTNALHFHKNDLAFIKNDRLLEDMDKAKAHEALLRHKRNRGELTRREMLTDVAPELDITHIIRERYPTYQDALEDIDDALTSAMLYASLTTSRYLTPKELAEFRKLADEFCLYCMATRAVTKVFFSTRGIYYAVQLPGCSKETVFVAPHDFVQKMPKDMDKNVIDSFALLHRVLLKNVMPKLYTDVGLEYPPPLPKGSSTSLVPICHELQKKLVNPESLPLSGVVCLLGRECPRRTLEMSIEGAGGYIANMGLEVAEGDAGAQDKSLSATSPITHVIIDRPYSDSLVQQMFTQCGLTPYESVTAVVPQYILDCINAQALLPPAPYTPIPPADGTPFRPPPHRSPFSTAASIPTTTIKREPAIATSEIPVENNLGEISKYLGSTPSRKEALKLSLQSMSRSDKRLLNKNLKIERHERARERRKKERADAYHQKIAEGSK